MKTDSRIISFALGSAIFLAACAEPNGTRTHPDAQAVIHVNSKVIHQASEDFLAKMTQTERFTGNALVMRGNNVIHAQAYGNATDEMANQLNTVFHVGSVTKQFTAAAIMQLVERGSLKLDDFINDCLPAKYRF